MAIVARLQQIRRLPTEYNTSNRIQYFHQNRRLSFKIEDFLPT